MEARRLITHVAAAIFSVTALVLGNDWDYPIWIPRTPDADPLYRFVKGDKVGYIDQTGRVIIRPVLPWYRGNGGGEFHDGLLEIGVSDGIYMNTRGEKVIDKRLYRGWDFSEGLAVALTKEGSKWGYINVRGEFAISPRFASSTTDYVWSFENGFAMIEVGAGSVTSTILATS